MPRKSIGKYNPEFLSGEVQKRVSAAAGYCCESCGVSSTYAQCGVHHIDMNRANDDARNLVWLCRPCHLEVHRFSWIPGMPLPSRWRFNPPRWVVSRHLEYVPTLFNLEDTDV